MKRGRAASFREAGPAALVFGAAFLAYLSTVSNGFVYDDRYLVERNPLVQGTHLWQLVSTSFWGEIVDAGLYRPLTLASFGVNRLFGASAFGFHFGNDLLHAAASVLALYGARAVGLGPFASLAAGLLFALHPVQSEAVEALVGRAEILAFAFVMVAFLLFARRARGLFVGVAFFLALASKESAAFALPLFVLQALRGDRDLAPKRFVPLAGAGALYGAARLAVLGGLGIGGREIGFLDNPLASASYGTRLLAAPALLVQYVKLVLWPSVLSADYSFDQIPIPGSLADPRVLLGLTVLALAVVVVRRRPTLRFGTLALLLPLAGFLHLLFPLGTIFAERLLYLPLFGAALLFGLGFGALHRRAPALAVTALALLATAAALRVQARTRDWKDNETLFRRTVETAPRSARAHFLLGAELLEKRRYAEAASSFERGLAIYPEHFGARMSLGQARLAAGAPAAAEEAFRRALAAEPRSDDARRAAVEAALTAGRELGRAGDLAEAREHFEAAVELAPTNPEALNDLGLVEERRDRVEAARKLYERALAADADFVEAVLNLASVRARDGALEEAESLYRRALELAPRSYEAYNGLGIVLARRGRVDDAARAFRRAIEIDPDLDAARENLRAVRPEEDIP